MKTHKVLLYGWWLFLLVALQILTQGAAYEDLIRGWVFPALGVGVTLHAAWLLWATLHRVYPGSLSLTLITGGMLAWGGVAVLHLTEPWTATDLSLWIRMGLWSGHLLWASGLILHLAFQGWGLVAGVLYLVGWGIQRASMPETWPYIPLLTLGLGYGLLLLGGAFLRTWAAWMVGLVGFWVFFAGSPALHPELVPFVPFLSAMLLAVGAYWEIRDGSRAF